MDDTFAALDDAAGRIDPAVHPIRSDGRVGVIRDVVNALWSMFPALGVRTTLEIGAREANFSRRTRTKFPDMRVVAFEANPKVAAHFGEIARAAGVAYQHSAIGPKDGELALQIPVRFGDQDASELAGTSSLRSSNNARWHTEPHSVPCMRLDTYVGKTELPTPLALWIDVEGAQADVLPGCRGALADTAIVYIEVETSFRWKEQWTVREVTAFFEDAGFVPFLRDVERPDQYNIIFVRREDHASLAGRFAQTRDKVLQRVEALAAHEAPSNTKV